MLRNVVRQSVRAPNLTPHRPPHGTFGEVLDPPSALGEAFRRPHDLPESPLPQRLQWCQATKRPFARHKKPTLGQGVKPIQQPGDSSEVAAVQRFVNQEARVVALTVEGDTEAYFIDHASQLCAFSVRFRRQKLRLVHQLRRPSSSVNG